MLGHITRAQLTFGPFCIVHVVGLVSIVTLTYHCLVYYKGLSLP